MRQCEDIRCNAAPDVPVPSNTLLYFTMLRKEVIMTHHPITPLRYSIAPTARILALNCSTLYARVAQGNWSPTKMDGTPAKVRGSRAKLTPVVRSRRRVCAVSRQ